MDSRATQCFSLAIPLIEVEVKSPICSKPIKKRDYSYAGMSAFDNGWHLLRKTAGLGENFGGFPLNFSDYFVLPPFLRRSPSFPKGLPLL
jgi:hypothetical protein